MLLLFFFLNRHHLEHNMISTIQIITLLDVDVTNWTHKRCADRRMFLLIYIHK